MTNAMAEMFQVEFRVKGPDGVERALAVVATRENAEQYGRMIGHTIASTIRCWKALGDHAQE